MATLADRSLTPPRYSHAPHALSLSLPDLISADGHRVSIVVSITLRLLERAADVAVFNEHFTAGERIALDDVRQYLAEAMRPAAESQIAAKDAADWLTDTAALQAALLGRLNAIGFACGLEFLPPTTVQTRSDSLAADRLAAATAQRQAAALERAAELRERIGRGEAGNLSAPQLADLLPAMLQSESHQPASFFLAAGPGVIDVTASPAAAVAVAGHATIGPLRSTRVFTVSGRPTLGMGGQRGVALVDLTGATPPQSFTLDQLASDRGFNAIAFDPVLGQLIATHGEIGIVRWTIAGNAPPLVTPLPGARLLLRLDDRLLLASGRDLIAVSGPPKTIAQNDAQGDAPVVALLDLDESAAVVRGNGQVARLDRTTLRPVEQFRHSSPVRCAAVLRVAGVRLMLLGTESGIVDIVTFAGQPVGNIRPRAGVSLLATSGATIAVLSSDRSTLELFAGGAASATINLVARFGHRATDLVAAPDRSGNLPSSQGSA